VWCEFKRERERGGERGRERACVCVSERVRKRERACVCVSERVKERVCVCRYC
jgi:hypothetical protein